MYQYVYFKDKYRVNFLSKFLLMCVIVYKLTWIAELTPNPPIKCVITI